MMLLSQQLTTPPLLQLLPLATVEDDEEIVTLIKSVSVHSDPVCSAYDLRHCVHVMNSNNS